MEQILAWITDRCNALVSHSMTYLLTSEDFAIPQLWFDEDVPFFSCRSHLSGNDLSGSIPIQIFKSEMQLIHL